METLELKFLGDINVARGTTVEALPPSRKTRALLAYLALQPRRFRREHLCELLWEQPDDPRGSLRWSLSKLRRVVDDPDCRRIVADRSYVSFATTNVSIDVISLRDLVARGLGEEPIEVLEHAAKQYDGYFLEGLDLSSFHEFHAWCIAERELSTQAQVELLTELGRRKRDAPDAALPYARKLVTIAPYSESARENLIRLLVALGRTGEAEQQYALGARMLREIGAEPTGALSRALKSTTRASAPERNGEPASIGTTAADSRIFSTAEERQLPIVGRDAELEAISTTIEAAVKGAGAKLLLFRGEPGIGKSRLLRAAAEVAQTKNAFLIASSAFESESIRPFAVWIDGLRRIAREAADTIFGTRDGENRERLLAGLSDLVTSESAARPVVLVLDDLQWIDDSSATALHYVFRTNRQHAVAGVLAAREGEIQDNAALQQALSGLRHAGLLMEMPVEPLSEAHVRELIDMHAPGLASEQLSRECGGNPLMAIELARAEMTGASGNSLNELLHERLSRFDVDSAEVMRWAAVLAPRIDVALLERLSDSSTAQVSNALELAERQGMLQPTELGYRFSHDLVASGISADISPARRRLMHRRVAELLERETAVELEHAADLAHHAAQSGDAGLAARAMVSAARLCLRFYANDEALSLAQRGLSLVEKLPQGERICLTIDFKDIMLVAAPLEDWESAVDEFVELAEQALDHGATAHARRGYYMASYVRWMRGHWSGARDEILQSERVARGGTGKDHIVGMAEAAHCLALLERDLTHADAMLMEAQALAAREHVAHHSIPAALGLLRFHENRLDLAESLFEEARTLAKSAGDRISEYHCNEHLIMIDIERNDYAAARKRCGTLIEIGTKLQFGSEGPFARALAAICDYAIDDDAGDIEPALDELRAADAKHRLAYALTRAALLDVEHESFEQALTRAAEALENASALDRATDMVLAHIALAKAHRALDDEAAFAHHQASIARFESSRVAEWARVRAEESLN